MNGDVSVNNQGDVNKQLHVKETARKILRQKGNQVLLRIDSVISDGPQSYPARRYEWWTDVEKMRIGCRGDGQHSYCRYCSTNNESELIEEFDRLMLIIVEETFMDLELNSVTPDNFNETMDGYVQYMIDFVQEGRDQEEGREAKLSKEQIRLLKYGLNWAKSEMTMTDARNYIEKKKNRKN